MNKNFNYKIVGSGPTGLLLAITLAKLNFNIYLTDLLTREKLINKDKTYAITHSTRKILSKFNLWGKLKFIFKKLFLSSAVDALNTFLNSGKTLSTSLSTSCSVQPVYNSPFSNIFL